MGLAEKTETSPRGRKQADGHVRTLWNSHVLGAYVMQDGRLCLVNRGFVNCLRYPEADLLGTDFLNLVHPEDAGTVSDNAARTLKGRRQPAHEYRLITNQGDTRWVAERTSRTEYQGKAALLGCFVDVTASRLNHAGPPESKGRVRLMLESATDSIIVTDLKGTVTGCNDSALRVHGFRSKSKILGRRLVQLVASCDRERVEAVLEKIMAGGATGGIECSLLREDGTEFAAEFGASALLDGRRRRRGFISTTRDITERKQLMTQLRESEKKFRDLADLLPQTVFETDEEGKFTFANYQGLVSFGYDPEDFARGLNILALVAPEDRARAWDHIEKQLQGKKLGGAELTAARKDGSRLPVVTYFSPVVRGNERVGLRGIIVDITERKRAEKALMESEEKYATLVEGGTDGIVIIQGGLVKFINSSMAVITGYPPVEAIGRPFAGFVSPGEDAPGSGGDGAGEPLSSRYETEIVARDGRRTPVEIRTSQIEYLGKPATMAIVRDVTERKQAEEKSRELEQMKSEFISAISHELRTPMHSIRGFTRVILSGKTPDPRVQQEFLGIIDRQCENLETLVDNLLDMSRLESGRFLVQKQPTLIRQVLLEAVKSFSPLAADKGIVITPDIGLTPAEIDLDATRIEQVISNLLSNAVKFSTKGGEIRVSATVEGTELIIRVSDQGYGIAEEAMSGLFEKFYRVKDTAWVGGAGLGLYISRQIVEAHGGRIWAKSKLGEGSTFSFALPLHSGGGYHGQNSPGR